jgi:hypothetical protein
MSIRTSRRSLRVLAVVILLAAVFGTAGRAGAIGFVMGQSKEELKLKYDVTVEHHTFDERGTGRVTVVLTLADEGRLKPLDEVQLVIPGKGKNKDGSHWMDLVVSIEMVKAEGGKRVGRVHMLRELAERAQIQLNTHTLDGKMDPLTRLHHVIAVRDHLKDGPPPAPAAKAAPAREPAAAAPAPPAAGAERVTGCLRPPAG